MAYSPKVYPTTPGLRYLHISQGVTELDVVFGPRDEGRRRSSS